MTSNHETMDDRMDDRIEFVPVMSRLQLLAAPVRTLIERIPQTAQASIHVAEIDPRWAGGTEFCDRYGIAYREGANCVLVEASRSGQVTHVACVITPGSRADLNGLVRRHLGARRVTLIPREEAIALTQMEYGSMTAVGLPAGWRVLVDSQISVAPHVVLGSGCVRSKMRLPGSLLLDICAAQSMSGLAVSRET
jgi:prolyl-tRNA editing enzyme YbaK/EbsC (Cys-tRNA(Pro) deacylase)